MKVTLSIPLVAFIVTLAMPAYADGYLERLCKGEAEMSGATMVHRLRGESKDQILSEAKDIEGILDVEAAFHPRYEDEALPIIEAWEALGDDATDEEVEVVSQRIKRLEKRFIDDQYRACMANI